MFETNRLAVTLASIPQCEWATSNKVARAYLECSKVRRILKHHGFKMRLPESQYSDIMQNAWVVLARGLPNLDRPENVYSYLYEIIRLCICSIQANTNRTEILRTDEEEGDEEQAIKPLANFDRGSHEDHSSQVITEIDREYAQARFVAKLQTYDWPDDIIRNASEYRRVGRPRKETEASLSE